MKKYKVPEDVKRQAKIGLDMKSAGFKGGTTTGWNRAKQLIRCDTIGPQTVKTMKAWFARHGPDAKNGGTSYPGYKKWVKNGKPMKPDSKTKYEYRGALAWLIWGGDPAYRWIKNINLD